MIKGERIYLIPYSSEHLTFLVKWHEDEWFDDVMSDEVGPKSPHDVAAFYSQFMAPRGRLFMGCIKPEDKSELSCIGVVALGNIDFKNRQSEIVGGIGFRSERNKGYGEDTIKTIIKWAREELGLHRIYAYVKSHNKLAVNSLKSAGFKQECEMKDAIYQNGRFINKVLLANTSGYTLNIDAMYRAFLSQMAKDNPDKKQNTGVLLDFIKFISDQDQIGE